MRRPPFALNSHPRGLSLVELMVGVTIGLFVVAAATVLVSTQLIENRRLLLDTQVQQDLRATADIVTRDLRRAGLTLEDLALKSIWIANGSTGFPQPLDGSVVNVATSGSVAYRYARPLGSSFLGFELSGDILRSWIGSGPAPPRQDVTDPNTLRVTAFTITRSVTPVAQLACPNLCTDGTQACWPTARVQEFNIVIEGTAASASSAQGRLTSTVRQRNPGVVFNTPSGSGICP